MRHLACHNIPGTAKNHSGHDESDQKSACPASQGKNQSNFPPTTYNSSAHLTPSRLESPFLGIKLLENSIWKDFGALKGSREGLSPGLFHGSRSGPRVRVGSGGLRNLTGQAGRFSKYGGGSPVRRWCAPEQHGRLTGENRLIRPRPRVRFPSDTRSRVKRFFQYDSLLILVNAPSDFFAYNGIPPYSRQPHWGIPGGVTLWPDPARARGACYDRGTCTFWFAVFLNDGAP